MTSTLELRHIIECGLQPLSCTCTCNPAEWHEDAPRQHIATATKLGGLELAEEEGVVCT